MIVTVMLELPAKTEPGFVLMIVGRGGLMVKVKATEFPLTVVTVMLAVPADVIRVAGTAAFNLVELK